MCQIRNHYTLQYHQLHQRHQVLQFANWQVLISTEPGVGCASVLPHDPDPPSESGSKSRKMLTIL